ncbi:MAG: type II toxin-antitoxin system VapC family toxin [Oceanicoccus sp.]|uniref:type II toxin-antitoxin system VapC family toxin n=1 Tax=Oceanicoccus sp. TaxID=2691044 RepID=UPI0026205F44|nr:type II toxin-antitoxin system VapC family toxin [Oceanicoccus sp.]MCP3907060.1 type II toxin-antitoxin system VapC family toxin [Oceanicoccus sp.]MDG1773012.1 type II toxin-antitoxin system VapC family toxin [Oceanicoccus sp.]
MIILDTNIVSEFMTSPPASQVLNWLNAQHVASLYISTITLAEINYGLSVMPTGKRRQLLSKRFTQFVDEAFTQRVLSFDEAAAKTYGELMGHRKEIGRPMSSMDGQIAAIARAKGFSVATRNIKDFEHCQIDLINPFD